MSAKIINIPQEIPLEVCGNCENDTFCIGKKNGLLIVICMKCSIAVTDINCGCNASYKDSNI
jgi:hypothetical protein